MLIVLLALLLHPDTSYLDKAKELAKQVIIVDGHVDVPYRLKEKWEDIGTKTAHGHFDWPRAKAGGLDAPFMSIYIPARYETAGGAKALAEELIEMVNGFTHKHPDKFALAMTPADIRANFKKGLISLPMGMENGSPIEGDLKNIQYFYNLGIRYITLTHSEDNHICDSSYDEDHKWKGLSPFGKKVVREMNRVGIMIDVSHISDDAFYQVMELSSVPVIASHSSCRYFTPGFERNMDDNMIKLLAQKGGVIMINFGSFFLEKTYNKEGKKAWDAFKAYLKANNFKSSDPEAEAFRQEYKAKHPMPTLTVADVVAHIDHVVKLVGVDYVGLGSDFDGVDDLPAGLEDVSKIPNLIAALLEKGYSETDIEKISSGNVFRVWQAVEAYAAKAKGI
jgi:membrane dipeptidase